MALIFILFTMFFVAASLYTKNTAIKKRAAYCSAISATMVFVVRYQQSPALFLSDIIPVILLAIGLFAGYFLLEFMERKTPPPNLKSE